MPIRPTPLERAAFHRLGLAPLPLLDVFGALSFHVLVAGLRLGVFQACMKPCSLSDIASELGVDEMGLKALLEALEAIGYLEHSDGRWVNSRATRRWLAHGDKSGVRAGVEYWARLLQGPLARPDENLTGSGGPKLYEWLAADQETADIFQDWMVEVSGLVGSEIIRNIPSSSLGDSLLDVGGGHGWYTVELCLRNPGLRATILDQPSATRNTARRVEEAGLSGRISIVDGDYLTFQTGKSFDTVIMFNILHGHRDDELQQLLTRSGSWLSDTGQLLVVEQFPVRFGLAHATTALLGLVYEQLLDGAAHDYQTIYDALTAAGYGRIKRHKMRLAPGTSLIRARR